MNSSCSSSRLPSQRRRLLCSGWLASASISKALLGWEGAYVLPGACGNMERNRCMQVLHSTTIYCKCCVLAGFLLSTCQHSIVQT